MPPSSHPDQDTLNLFLLNELERLNILVGLLTRRGQITAEDVALAQLKQDLKHQQRLFDRGEASPAAVQALAELRRQIAGIEAAMALSGVRG